MERAVFAEGFHRLTEAQQVFVTEDMTKTYWEILSQLSPSQWGHTVRVALEDPDPPEPGKMWPPGRLLAWGRSYLDPRQNLRLVAPVERATQDSAFPRRPGETAYEYVQRYARHLTGDKGTEVRTMPEARLPYKEPEEAEVDRGDNADNY